MSDCSSVCFPVCLPGGPARFLLVCDPVSVQVRLFMTVPVFPCASNSEAYVSYPSVCACVCVCLSVFRSPLLFHVN